MTPPEQAMQTAKALGDGLSLSVVLASLMSWIPEATAVLSFIWVCIRLWETPTVQGWFGRKR